MSGDKPGFRTTHIRVERNLLQKKKELYPEMSANEVFKLGLQTLNGINRIGENVWGNAWKKQYGKK